MALSSTLPASDLTIRMAARYSLAGVARWLRLTDEELVALEPRSARAAEMRGIRIALVAELASRGITV